MNEHKNDPIVDLLIKQGQSLLDKPIKKIEFTKNSVIDDYLNDLDNYPHFFVLACLMDRQMKAEKAWMIPYYVSLEIGNSDFKSFTHLSYDEIRNIFHNNQLHRFNDIMSKFFYFAIQRINKTYLGDASQIWKTNLLSATVMRRFLQFEGVGIKIASMATNTLARDFKILMKDKICIDISPDVHVKRVFTRIGLIERDSSIEELVYCAKELNPEYPGIFDLSAWEIGRNWCRPYNPDCSNCYLSPYCRKKY
jgi:endonuclease III